MDLIIQCGHKFEEIEDFEKFSIEEIMEKMKFAYWRLNDLEPIIQVEVGNRGDYNEKPRKFNNKSCKKITFTIKECVVLNSGIKVPVVNGISVFSDLDITQVQDKIANAIEQNAIHLDKIEMVRNLEIESKINSFLKNLSASDKENLFLLMQAVINLRRN